MLIVTLYQEDGEDHYKVHVVEEGVDEPIDCTTEFEALPMRLGDSESGRVLEGFFIGKEVESDLLDEEEDEEDEPEEWEPLPGADDIDFDE